MSLNNIVQGKVLQNCRQRHVFSMSLGSNRILSVKIGAINILQPEFRKCWDVF